MILRKCTYIGPNAMAMTVTFRESEKADAAAALIRYARTNLGCSKVFGIPNDGKTISFIALLTFSDTAAKEHAKTTMGVDGKDFSCRVDGSSVGGKVIDGQNPAMQSCDIAPFLEGFDEDNVSQAAVVHANNLLYRLHTLASE